MYYPSSNISYSRLDKPLQYFFFVLCDVIFRLTILTTLASFWSWTMSGMLPALLLLEPDMLFWLQMMRWDKKQVKREVW